MTTHGPAVKVPWWAPGLDRHGREHASGTGIKCSRCLNEVRLGGVVAPVKQEGRLWVGCPCLYVVAANWHVSPGHLAEDWLEKVKAKAAEEGEGERSMSHPELTIPKTVDWTSPSAGQIIAGMRETIERMRHMSWIEVSKRKRMVYTSKGWWEFAPSSQGVFAVHYGTGYFVGMFQFTDSRRRQHSRVLKHWFDGRCER